MANDVTICAAPPADTSKCHARTGMMGIIIDHAAERNVVA
jgi:hypothetical protein